MAIKRKISKNEYDKLSDLLKAEYIEDGDSYRLDVDGEEDTGALKRAKEREKQLRQEAEKKMKEYEEKLNSIEGDDARKKGDIATLEKAWQKKHDETAKAYEERINRLSVFAREQLIDGVASRIASEISTSPKLLMPHIKARLAADLDGDKPTTRVLDENGQVSALNLDELKQSFLTNKDFSAILIASKASGGAGGERKAGFSESGNAKPANLSGMNAAQLAAFLSGKSETA